MHNRTFKTSNNLELVIKNRKSAIIFEIGGDQTNSSYNFFLHFTPKGFEELLKYIESVASASWINLKPRESYSLGADYYEYYDRELDNNGYLRIKQNSLIIERPSLKSNKIYQFNKRKMESFIFDFRKMIKTA